MKILFLHGLGSTPGGLKPTYLKDHGHEVINPHLPDDDFELSVSIAQTVYDKHYPDVVVGSSRGGAVAMNIDSKNTPHWYALPKCVMIVDQVRLARHCFYLGGMNATIDSRRSDAGVRPQGADLESGIDHPFGPPTSRREATRREATDSS